MERTELTKAMRWKIAEYLADDRLEMVNAGLKPVKVKDTIYVRYIKRALDIVIALAALVCTLPINVLLGVGTLIDVGVPIFFRQERIGKDGRVFHILKFRNMRDLYDEHGELLPPAQRVTKFGRFVRKTSLDELLNFWSILKGDMSLIGPRPLVPEYHHRYHDRHVMRLAVRPGLECPPRSLDNHVWTWQEQLDNDVWYVENVSFLTDCKMICNLVRFALDRKSTNARAEAARGTFMGYGLDGKAITLNEVPQAYIDKVTAEMDGTEKPVPVPRRKSKPKETAQNKGDHANAGIV